MWISWEDSIGIQRTGRDRPPVLVPGLPDGRNETDCPPGTGKDGRDGLSQVLLGTQSSSAPGKPQFTSFLKAETCNPLSSPHWACNQGGVCTKPCTRLLTKTLKRMLEGGQERGREASSLELG